MGDCHNPFAPTPSSPLSGDFGKIIFWSGAIVDIPEGWVLCDGNNGTPDLRNRFLVGSGFIFDPGDSGSAPPHNHEFTTDGHTHDLESPRECIGAGAHDQSLTTETDSAFSSNSEPLPKYYALAYIMSL